MQIQINPATINAFDRLTHYGDGCFTTAAFSNGKVEYLDAHLKRIHDESQTLDLFLEERDIDELGSVLIKLAGENTNGVLKVLLSSGLSERGYLRSETPQLACYVFVLPQVNHYVQWREKGITLGVANRTLGGNDTLSKIKHANRLEQVLFKQDIPEGCDDVIVCADSGHFVETTAANVFFKVGACWFTPELIKCGVEGVMRNRLLSVFAENNWLFQEMTATLPVLNDASDLFICNSLMQVVPVNTLLMQDGVQVAFSNSAIPEVQRILSKDIERCKDKEKT